VSTDSGAKDNDHVQVVSVDALTEDDKAFLKYGQQIVIGSGDSIKDFSKTMITVNSGLFATYFAILKFLGLGSEPTQVSFSSLAIVPPLLFIFSIMAFVFAVVPLQDRLSLQSADSIIGYRDRTLKRKYRAMVTGLAFFLAGMAVMTVVSLGLLNA
jgi:hypothetical protein